MRRKIFLSAFIVGVMLIQVLGCGTNTTNPYSLPPANNNPPNTVTMMNMAFSPASITIAKMSTITWKNNDNVVHTATSENGLWDTGTISPGGTKTTVFDSTGTFPYRCAVHPMMTGTIIVQ